MAAKIHGISPDLLIHPGETISDLLQERGISQKELAQRAGVSEAFLSDVIHGKKDISKGLAKGLEYAFGVPVSFWLNLQANYDAELIDSREMANIEEGEIAVLTEIREIVSYLRRRSVIEEEWTCKETVIGLRRYFQVSRLTGLSSLVPSGAFRISDKVTISPYVLGAWLCLCKAQGTDKRLESQFDLERIDELILKLKIIMMARRIDLQRSLKDLFAQYGIDFSIVHNFRGAPVHGFISGKEDGTYKMVLTLRGAYADIFWFSIFHELGHIVNGDVSKKNSFIDAAYSRDSHREEEADAFASKALLESNSYNQFVRNGSYSYNSIQAFARTQNVPPYIVIGRLQKEEVIPWTWYQQYKLKYKWAEET